MNNIITREAKTLTKFIFIGIINTLVCLTIIYYLRSITENEIFSNISGYSIAVLVSYYLNSKITFKFNTKCINTFARFLFAFIISWSANIIIVLTLIDNNITPYLSHLLGMPVYTIVFYLLSRFYVFKKTNPIANKKAFTTFLKGISNNKTKQILIAIIILYFCFFYQIGIWRHYGYLESINDIASFDQAIWRSLYGKGLLINTSTFSNEMNWLGFHFQPILYLFKPLYLLYPTIKWLIFAQSAAIALSAIPIFIIATEITKSERQSLTWSIIYLFNPFLISANSWDFHPIALATPIIAIALLAIHRSQTKTLVISCLFLLAFKEHMGLTVFGLGLYRKKVAMSQLKQVALEEGMRSQVNGRYAVTYRVLALGHNGEKWVLAEGLKGKPLAEEALHFIRANGNLVV